MLFSVKMNFVPLFYNSIIRWLSKKKQKKNPTLTHEVRKKHTAENTTHIVSARRDQG